MASLLLMQSSAAADNSTRLNKSEKIDRASSCGSEPPTPKKSLSKSDRLERASLLVSPPRKLLLNALGKSNSSSPPTSAHRVSQLSTDAASTTSTDVDIEDEEECMHCGRDDILPSNDADEDVYDCSCCDATLCRSCWLLTHDNIYNDDAGTCCVVCVAECRVGARRSHLVVAQRGNCIRSIDTEALQRALELPTSSNQ
jgi:hypothetical protein